MPTNATLSALSTRRLKAEDEALAATLDKMASEALDSTHRRAGSFEPAEGIKKVPLDPSHSDDKALQISTTLDDK